MKEVTAYRCEHCGRLYAQKHHCLKHEPLCTLNPQTRPLCYSCQNYNTAALDEKMRVYYDTTRDPFSEDPYVIYSLNKCEARKEYTDCFLFNKRKQSKKILRALKDEGFIPMPSLSSGGCDNYKPIEGHPYSITNNTNSK